MKQPFSDLYAQYLTIKPGIDLAIARVIGQSAYIRGPFVEAFEKEFAAVMGMPHCVSCANGTDSLFIAMRALGLAPGDEVITPAHSWIASSETITLAGGRPVFVDTDEDTFTLNPALLEEKITPRTRGIIVVHLYGHPADMDAIMSLARRHQLWVIEDCAQAHLARHHGALVGTFGAASSFSFFPGKNLGAYGDAGAIMTGDATLAGKMTVFARHGTAQPGSGRHEIEGINSRLDGLQAAILSVKLEHLARWTQRRREIAALYDRLLAGVGDLVTPAVREGCEHVYHLYVIRTSRRDSLKAWLAEKDISTVVNYPVALPFLEAYHALHHQPADFPVAHGNQSRILSLPLYPEMTDDMVESVAEQIRAFFAR